MANMTVQRTIAGSVIPAPRQDPNPRRTPATPAPSWQLIRQTRLRYGLTQRALAEALVSVSANDGVTREEVSRWERGKRIPSPYWRCWLSEVLRLPSDQLERAASTARALRKERNDS
jgi:DNA-binding transcriptional regulator YiaG